MIFLDSTMRFTNSDGTMKRPSSSDDEQAQSAKRAKHSNFIHFLQAIPHELVLLILEHLSRKDLIQLCSTSRSIRYSLEPYLFSHVKASWCDLLSVWHHEGKPAAIRNASLIEKLRLTTCCSQNEWTFPFAELLRGNLTTLELSTSGSTNFFKYSTEGSQLQVLQVHAVKSGSVFNMEHLVAFTQLKRLSLQYFEIEAFEENDWCPQLSTLALDDCTWRYPFQLENFGRNKIDSLTLRYTNHFVISERFKMFLNGPHFRSLRHLSITNRDKNLKLTLSVHVMKLIESIPTLRTLELRGNIYNETLNNFSNADWENCIKYVGVRNVKVFYSSFLN